MVVVVLVLVLVEDKEGEEKERLEASIIVRNRGATVER